MRTRLLALAAASLLVPGCGDGAGDDDPAGSSSGGGSAAQTEGVSNGGPSSTTSGSGPTDTTSADGTTRADDDTGTDGGTGTDTGRGDGLYEPDDGPGHDGGTIVDVCSEAEILAAIETASAGDVITVCPGTFSFNQMIPVMQDGTDAERIFLRAEAPNTVTFNLTHIENFRISGKFWIFENITFFGNCDGNASSCEHAFHIVADADDLIFRNNEVVNFASHVKLNGEVVGDGPGQSFPDRTWFIGNFWHNTRYIQNAAPHNILNLDGGQDHVARGNIFADYATPVSLQRSASAIYPKASAIRMLIEMNLVVCEKSRTEGETTRGIQIGDGAPATICDGDPDQDGIGDCEENGQSQEAIVRNNIVMGCNNGGSAAGLMVGSDRDSRLTHNTVYDAEPRSAGFYQGHPDHDTLWRFSILENGVNTDAAVRPLDEADNVMPSREEMNGIFTAPSEGDFSLLDGTTIQDYGATDPNVPHDFCGYPRGDTADLGAIEYSTEYEGTPCATIVKQMYDRIP